MSFEAQKYTKTSTTAELQFITVYLKVASFLCSSAGENTLTPLTFVILWNQKQHRGRGSPAVMSQCCKVYQMHAIVTTVTAIFYFVFFFVYLYFVFCFIWQDSSQYGAGMHKSLFMIFTHVVSFCCLIVCLYFFCNILFRIAAARHRGAASSQLLGDSVHIFVLYPLAVQVWKECVKFIVYQKFLTMVILNSFYFAVFFIIIIQVIIMFYYLFILLFLLFSFRAMLTPNWTKSWRLIQMSYEKMDCYYRSVSHRFLQRLWCWNILIDMNLGVRSVLYHFYFSFWRY